MPSRRAIAFRWHAKLDDFVTQVAWSPDGTRLAAASVSGQVHLFEVATERALHRLEPAHEDGCDALAWRPDGAALATAGRDGKWRLWDSASGKQLIEHDAGAIWPEHAAWSTVRQTVGRGRLAAGLGWRSARARRFRFGTKQGEPVGEPMKLPRAVVDLAWVLGGRTLAVAISTTIYLREIGGTARRAGFFPRKRPGALLCHEPLRQVAADRQPGRVDPRLELRCGHGDAHARLPGQGAAAWRGIAAAAGSRPAAGRASPSGIAPGADQKAARRRCSNFTPTW